jgi:hypothetical protein
LGIYCQGGRKGVVSVFRYFGVSSVGQEQSAKSKAEKLFTRISRIDTDSLTQRRQGAKGAKGEVRRAKLKGQSAKSQEQRGKRAAGMRIVVRKCQQLEIVFVCQRAVKTGQSRANENQPL